MEVRDNEIIKALECCQVDESCKGCPSQRKFGKDAICPHLNELAVDLINRQKAETEALKDDVEFLDKNNDELIRETERLQKAIKVQDIMIEQQDYKIKSAKAEARKEFAERLKEKVGFPKDTILGKLVYSDEIDNLLAEMEGEGMKYRKKPVVVEAYKTDKEMIIHTLEGDIKASIGDYIITGVSGEQYPCKPDIFEETYEAVKGGGSE